MTDIEAYVKQLKGNRNHNKISVAMYDPIFNNYHFLFKINRRQDTCVMISTSMYPDKEYVDLSLPFISQLNDNYGYCFIEETNNWINRHYEELVKKYGYY